MGASTFLTTSTGPTAQAAFQSACEHAGYTHGHGGYSGTIAEKPGFHTISCPAGLTPVEYAQAVLDEQLPAGGASHTFAQHVALADDKYGPALHLPLGDDQHLFFGRASA